MAIPLQQSIRITSKKPLDSYYTDEIGGIAQAYASTTVANAKVPVEYRSLGKPVLVIDEDGNETEYWWPNNTTTLVKKYQHGIAPDWNTGVGSSSTSTTTSSSTTTTTTTPPQNGTAWVDSTIVFDGDSITYGWGSVDGDVTAVDSDRWTSHLIALKGGGTEINIGNAGACLMDEILGYCTKGVYSPSRFGNKPSNGKYFFISYGVNDIFCNNPAMTAANFETTLKEAIEDIKAKGWAANQIVVLSPFYVNPSAYASQVSTCGVTTAADVTRHEAFVASAANAASAKGTNYIDIYTWMKTHGGNSLLGDGVHPNGAGYQQMGAYIATQIN